MRTLLALLAALALTLGAAHAEDGPEPISAAFLAYASLQNDISAIDNAPIEGATLMDAALERAARHERHALTRGFIAYGALTAAQSPAFVAGVEGRVRAAGRAAVLRQLRSDASYARRRPAGASEAIGLILSMAASDRARLDRVADFYDGVGRRLQQSEGAHPSDADRAARIARLSALASTTPAAAGLALNLAATPTQGAPTRRFGGRHFWDEASAPFANEPALPAQRETRAGLTNQLLTLAALFLIDASDEEPVRVNALLDDEATELCLNMAQLHFRQCASVAYGADEDAFCLARHGLRDVGACLGGVTAPL